jgi:hypothetical protein
VLEPGDSIEIALRNMAVQPGTLQVFLTNQATVSVVNSAVIGAGAAIACGALSASEALCVGIGVLVLLLSVVAHQVCARRRFEGGVANVEALFP